MRKMLSVGMFLFALMAVIPGAFSAQPPLSPWPPEEEWYPISRDEARPEMRMVTIYGEGQDLGAGEPFYLRYAWLFVPTNVAYDYVTGEQVTAFVNLQDRTDYASCKYTVTMDGEYLEPTSSFRGTCKWYRFVNRPPEGEYLAVAPRAVVSEYYIEFPQGLSEGNYEIFLYGQPVGGGEPFSHTTIIQVSGS